MGPFSDVGSRGWRGLREGRKWFAGTVGGQVESQEQPAVWVWSSYGRAGPEVQVRGHEIKVVGCVGTEALA